MPRSLETLGSLQNNKLKSREGRGVKSSPLQGGGSHPRGCSGVTCAKASIGFCNKNRGFRPLHPLIPTARRTDGPSSGKCCVLQNFTRPYPHPNPKALSEGYVCSCSHGPGPSVQDKDTHGCVWWGSLISHCQWDGGGRELQAEGPACVWQV